MKQKLVIIGAGMASGRLIDHLVAEAPEAYDITLFNAEPRGNYNRLMLSPVLAGDKSYAEIVTHTDDWYAAQGITCRFGEGVIAIDRTTRTVTGCHGALPYDRLVIATGSAPFVIPLPGRDLPGVLCYRDLDDTKAMIAAAAQGGRAVVIGGGLLGLEAAAGLAQRGMQVTVLHLVDHLMDRQLDAEAAGMLRQDLETRGITVKTGAVTQAIEGDDQVERVRLQDGTLLPADLVVMAVGIRPEVQLAAACNLPVNRGLLVNAQLQTGDPDVFGLGECVEYDGQLFGLVAPLYAQARVLANTLMGRRDQFVLQDLATKLKVTGCDLFSAGDFANGTGREEILFRDAARRIYKRLVIRDNRLIGAVIYGDSSDGAWFFDLIQQGRDISDMRDTLIFGPAYQPQQTAPTKDTQSDRRAA